MRNIDLKNMHEHYLAFIDLETTGLVPAMHEIIEIGYLIVDQADLRVVKQHVIQVKPVHVKTADPEALRVIHYEKRDWSAAVDLAAAMKRFSRDVEGCIMVGQNITVDWAFIRAALSQLEMPDPMHYHRLDIMSMAFGLLHDDGFFRKYSLHELTEFFSLKIKNVHTAADDIQATFEVYKKLLTYRRKLR